jgi:ATP-dependent Lhr-like helicase
MDSLVRAGRAFRIESGQECYWVAAERRSFAESLTTIGSIEPPPAGEDDALDSSEPETAMVALVRGWIECSGPVDAGTLSGDLGFERNDILTALVQLEGEGLVLRGRFTDSGGPGEEFCDRRILARIHRATLRKLRREIEPVPAARFLRFLLAWQHVLPGARLVGETGVLEVVEQLQGFEAAGASWEDEILPARVKDYDPALLDRHCMTGDVVWGRWTRRETQSMVPSRRPGLSRSAPIGLALREDMAWLLESGARDEEALSAPARSVLGFLRNRGASFFAEMRAGTNHLPSEIEEALWQLVAAGLVTADSFSSLRALVSGEAKRQQASRNRRRQPRRTREGRWSLLRQPDSDLDNKQELWARQSLRRYGVMLRELLTREPGAPPWRDLIRVLRRMEARGEIRGGRFVAGFSGEQFALAEAVEALRSEVPAKGEFLRVSGCDPLNLAGILTPGPKVPAVLGNRIVYRDGVPVAAVESGETKIFYPVEEGAEALLERLLDPRPASAFHPDRAAK